MGSPISKPLKAETSIFVFPTSVTPQSPNRTQRLAWLGEEVRRVVGQSRPLAYTTVLTLLDRLAREPSLGAWRGLGLAVQAYQKRAAALIPMLATLAKRGRFASGSNSE